MRCYQCGGNYLKRHGKLEWVDDFAGAFTVEEVDYQVCEDCGQRLLPFETTKRIETTRKTILENKLQTIPIGEFIGASAAAKILGISRQALHKNSKIRKGKIFWMEFEGKRVYLRESVALFKETGDGRFLLVKPEGEKAYRSESKTAPIDVHYQSVILINLHQPAWPRDNIQSSRSMVYGYQ